MIKKLFIGSTDIDFLKVGKLFYRIFIIEALIFIAVFIFSLTGILNVIFQLILLEEQHINLKQITTIQILMR